MSIARILEQSGNTPESKQEQVRKPRTWEALTRLALPSAENQRKTQVRVSQSGRLFSISVVNEEDRPVGITGTAEELEARRDEVIEQVRAAFNHIAKAQAEFVGRNAVRVTGKTERDRQKKQNVKDAQLQEARK